MIAKPISYSKEDTAETRAELLKYECTGHDLCGWPASKEVCGGK